MRLMKIRRHVLAALVLFGLFGGTLPARAEEPGGTYRAQGLSPAGRPYAGTVEILPQGQGVHLAWQIEDGSRYLGLGLRLDDILGVAYWPLQIKTAAAGVVVYRLEGGRLIGNWMALQGPRDALGQEELLGPAGLEGRFDIVRGVNPGGGSGYKGHVEISRRGEAYYFRWFTPTASTVGNGVRIGNIMVVGYASGAAPGVVAYCLGARNLDGLWASPETPNAGKVRLGRETLSKESGNGENEPGDAPGIALPSDCTAQSAAAEP